MAMFHIDLALGMHWMIFVIYPAMKPYKGHVTRVNDHQRTWRIVGASLLGSVAFFPTTNFACWVAYCNYSLAGFTPCFVSAIPFFQNTLAGDFVFSGVLFGALASGELQFEALSPNYAT
jgi:hypothetical protein